MTTQCSTKSICKKFLNIFNVIYDVNFPLTEIELKSINMKTPWYSKVRKILIKRVYILNFEKTKALNLKKNIKTTKIFSKSLK